MTDDPHPINASLERWIKNIYLIVLGLGFSFIIRDLVVRFETPVVTVTTVVYFLALYYFLSYDWIAYSALINEYPYEVAEHSDLFYQGRFYIDMTHLLFKTVLIFLPLRPYNRVTLAAIPGLFAAWHATVVVWHEFGRREYPDGYDVPSRSHALMVFPFVGLSGGVWFLFARFPGQYTALVLVLVLSSVILYYTTFRKRTIIRKLGTGSE